MSGSVAKLTTPMALGPEREDRRQRKSGLKPARSDTIAICESYPCPPPPGSIFIYHNNHFAQAFGITL